jgi:hypothetical protein
MAYVEELVYSSITKMWNFLNMWYNQKTCTYFSKYKNIINQQCYIAQKVTLSLLQGTRFWNVQFNLNDEAESTKYLFLGVK